MPFGFTLQKNMTLGSISYVSWLFMIVIFLDKYHADIVMKHTHMDYLMT